MGKATVSFDLFPLQLMEELGSCLCRSDDPSSLFRETMSFLHGTLGVEGGLLLSMDSRGAFSVKGTFGTDFEPLKGNCWDPSEEMRRELERLSPVTLPSPKEDPLLAPYAESEGLFLFTPLYAAGRLRGALGTLHLSPPWEEEKLEKAMTWVASLLSPALALSSLWEELSIDEILERKIDHALCKMASAEGQGEGLLSEVLGIVEKRLIAAVLRRVGNIQTAAARLLGINRNTLRKKIREHGIEV